MKRTLEHNKKISHALKGKKKTVKHRRNMSIASKQRCSVPENNPNYRGDRVGYTGIHLWLRKHHEKHGVCQFCEEQKRTVWALISAKDYERKRENFIELCYKCHRNYDKTVEWNKNISNAKKLLNTNTP